jgi:hypothetical protein
MQFSEVDKALLAAVSPEGVCPFHKDSHVIKTVLMSQAPSLVDLEN